MDIVKLGRALTWAISAALLAAIWIWAGSRWGLDGMALGWIPALVAARVTAHLAWLLWSLVGFIALIGWSCYGSDPGYPSRRSRQA